jgi:hypothetical protein
MIRTDRAKVAQLSLSHLTLLGSVDLIVDALQKGMSGEQAAGLLKAVADKARNL